MEFYAVSVLEFMNCIVGYRCLSRILTNIQDGFFLQEPLTVFILDNYESCTYASYIHYIRVSSIQHQIYWYDVFSFVYGFCNMFILKFHVYLFRLQEGCLQSFDNSNGECKFHIFIEIGKVFFKKRFPHFVSFIDNFSV